MLIGDIVNNVLLYTDNHFCSTSSIVRKRGNKYTVRLENQLDTMSWLIEMAKEYNCTDMMCLGDFFNSNTLNAEELSCLSEIDFESIPQHFLVGNHEMGNATLEYTSVHSFLINKQCEVYNKPAIIGIGSTLFYILPYQLEINRKDNIMEYFPNIVTPNEIKYKVLLTHNDIAGINVGNFITKDGFDKEQLSKNFNLVINGHIHNQQWITKNVLNLGNITGQNFSEDSIKYKHQCMILDCDTLQYKLITNPRAFNFCKLDFTGKQNDIDYINRVSAKMGNNCVVTIKTTQENYEYIKYRFDPEYNPTKYVDLLPKQNNILQARIVVEQQSLQQDKEEQVSSVKTLHLNHLQEFENFVLQTLGTNDIIKSELQAVLQ